MLSINEEGSIVTIGNDRPVKLRLTRDQTIRAEQLRVPVPDEFEGKELKAGDVIEVPMRVARELLRRRRAATYRPKPGEAEPEPPVGDGGETDPPKPPAATPKKGGKASTK